MSEARRAERTPDAGTRTRRVVVLAVLGVVCALVLAPPLRLYAEQQQDVAALREDIAERESDVARLEGEVSLWGDDAHVAAQARERLGYVMPGETGFVVPDQDAGTAQDGTAQDGTAQDGTAPDGTAQDGTMQDGTMPDGTPRPGPPPEGTWYARLWSSVEATGTGASDPVLDAPVVPGDGATAPTDAADG